MLNTKAVVNVLNYIPRRGGLQTEGEYAVKVLLEVKKLISDSSNLNNKLVHELALVHNVKEVVNDGDLIKQILLNCNQKTWVGLSVLTRQEEETPKQHLNRILECNVKEILYVAMASCLVNSKYTKAEALWHDKNFPTSFKKERIKYLTMVGKIMEKLNSLID